MKWSALPQGKEPSVPTEYETGWTPQRVWTSCEEFYTVTDRTGLWLHISTVQQKRTLTLSRRKKKSEYYSKQCAPISERGLPAFFFFGTFPAFTRLSSGSQQRVCSTGGMTEGNRGPRRKTRISGINFTRTELGTNLAL